MGMKDEKTKAVEVVTCKYCTLRKSTFCPMAKIREKCLEEYDDCYCSFAVKNDKAEGGEE